MSCRRCKRKGRAETCNHPSPDRPEWKSEDAFHKVKAIFGDRKTLLAREIMGLVADDQSLAFAPAHLKRLFRSLPFAEPHMPVRNLYVAVDPNGFGSSDDASETAVVSFFYESGQVVVREQRAQYSAPTCNAKTRTSHAPASKTIVRKTICLVSSLGMYPWNFIALPVAVSLLQSGIP